MCLEYIYMCTTWVQVPREVGGGVASSPGTGVTATCEPPGVDAEPEG